MNGFMYDFLMNFGPVIFVGTLTIYGIKMTLNHNEKIEFGKQYAYKKNLYWETKYMIMDIVEYAHSTRGNEYLLEYFTEQEKELTPYLKEIAELTPDSKHIRSYKEIFRRTNDIERNSDGNPKDYNFKQIENLMNIRGEIEKIIRDLEKEDDKFNK